MPHLSLVVLSCYHWSDSNFKRKHKYIGKIIGCDAPDGMEFVEHGGERHQ